MAALEKKELQGEHVRFVVPTRFEHQEKCSCDVGLHPYWVQPIPVGRVTYEPGKEYAAPAKVAEEIQRVINEQEKTAWQFVEVPKVDMWGYKFASGIIRINKDQFPVGASHKVPPNMIATLKGIIASRQAHDVSLGSNQVNLEALAQLAGAKDSLTRAASGGSIPIAGSPEQIAQIASR